MQLIVFVIWNLKCPMNLWFSKIKESANEFEEQFECLGENSEKYKTFSITIEKWITKKRLKMGMKVL